MSRKNKLQESTFFNNTLRFSHYFDMLTEIALASFRWLNMPDTIDIRFLENNLYSRGSVVFFYDDVVGYLALPYTVSGGLDVYGYPNNITAYSSNGYTTNLNQSNSVIIYNNFTRTPCIDDVRLFAEKLANADSAIDININSQKKPILLQCNEKQKLSLVNLFNQYSQNMPVIATYDDFDQSAISVLNLTTQFIAPQLIQTKLDILNECLTYLGIPNISSNKKERLISDEINKNQGAVNLNKAGKLYTRLEACKKINDMFGLSINCEFVEKDGDFVV